MTADQLQELWNNARLPREAFERLSDGGYWSLTPPPDISSGPTGYADQANNIAIVADFRGIPAQGRRTTYIVGQWRGDDEWLVVGHIEEV